jgi:hypothetical protein
MEREGKGLIMNNLVGNKRNGGIKPLRQLRLRLNNFYPAAGVVGYVNGSFNGYLHVCLSGFIRGVKRIIALCVTNIYVHFEIIINLLPYGFPIIYFLIIWISKDFTSVDVFLDCMEKGKGINAPVNPEVVPIMHTNAPDMPEVVPIIDANAPGNPEVVPEVVPIIETKAPGNQEFSRSREEFNAVDSKFEELNKKTEKLLGEVQEGLREYYGKEKIAITPKNEETIYVGKTDSNSSSNPSNKEPSLEEKSDIRREEKVVQDKSNKETDGRTTDNLEKKYAELGKNKEEAGIKLERAMKEEKEFNDSWRGWVTRGSEWLFRFSFKEIIFMTILAAVAIPVIIISAVHVLPLLWRIGGSWITGLNWFVGKTIGKLWMPTKAESFAQGAKDIVATGASAFKSLGKEAAEAASAAGIVKGPSFWAYIVGATSTAAGAGWGVNKVIKIAIRIIRMKV